METAVYGGLDHAVPRVGDERCAGIAKQCYRVAVFQTLEYLRRAAGFVMFVIADEGLFNLIVLEKLLRLTRILAGDDRNFLTKDAQSTDCNIFQVSDGRRDYIESARQTLAVYR
jgi:hypothetical protein